MNRTTHLLTAAVVLVLAGCSDDATSVTPDRTPITPSASDPGLTHLSFLSQTGAAAAEATVQLPDGFQKDDDWYVVSSDGDTFLGLWVVTEVDRDACRGGERDAVDPGPSVDALARALVDQRGTTSPPAKEVDVAGVRAEYVELTSPADISRCDDVPALWRTPERPIYGSGQVDRVWILEADGERLVLDASYSRSSTEQEREALTAMVGSLELVPAQTT